jgi:UDP-sugar transporter A1/2/3
VARNHHHTKETEETSKSMQQTVILMASNIDHDDEAPLKPASSIRRNASRNNVDEAQRGSISTEDVIHFPTADAKERHQPGITSMGLKVLILLAFQNSSKNLLMRFVMKEKPEFLTSAAVISSGTKALIANQL